jgi:hypothetical protein
MKRRWQRHQGVSAHMKQGVGCASSASSAACQFAVAMRAA